MQLFSHGKNGSRARAPNDDVAQHGGLTLAAFVYSVACIFDVEHSYYGHLAPVKTRYPLTSVM